MIPILGKKELTPVKVKLNIFFFNFFFLIQLLSTLLLIQLIVIVTNLTNKELCQHKTKLILSKIWVCVKKKNYFFPNCLL